MNTQKEKEIFVEKGSEVTSLAWNRDELFVGDNSGYITTILKPGKNAENKNSNPKGTPVIDVDEDDLDAKSDEEEEPERPMPKNAFVQDEADEG